MIRTGTSSSRMARRYTRGPEHEEHRPVAWLRTARLAQRLDTQPRALQRGGVGGERVRPAVKRHAQPTALERAGEDPPVEVRADPLVERVCEWVGDAGTQRAAGREHARGLA